MASKPDDPNYKCAGCQRNELHFVCPACETHFYMSGVPYTEQIAEFYDILDTDDKEKFFNMLSECCNLWNKYIPTGNPITLDRQEVKELGRKDTEWHSDESWCPNCKTYTTHRIKWGGHERDSTHDQSICTVCDWSFNGYTGEYEQPYTDI